MTDEQILREAIAKAEKNGYEFAFEQIEIIFKDTKGIWGMTFYGRKENFNLDVNTLIFNHDFAKAFWGEKETAYQISPVRFIDAINKPVRKVKAYEAHLVEMVLEEEPLKYLEKFL